MNVSTGQVLRSLGKSEAIEVLNVLEKSDKGRGFNELKNEIGTDAKTLTRRLDELGSLGVTEKKNDANYHITPVGSRILELAFEIEEEISGSGGAEVVR